MTLERPSEILTGTKRLHRTAFAEQHSHRRHRRLGPGAPAQNESMLDWFTRHVME